MNIFCKEATEIPTETLLKAEKEREELLIAEQPLKVILIKYTPDDCTCGGYLDGW